MLSLLCNKPTCFQQLKSLSSTAWHIVEASVLDKSNFLMEIFLLSSMYIISANRARNPLEILNSEGIQASNLVTNS